jgi:hypothetical protein
MLQDCALAHTADTAIPSDSVFNWSSRDTSETWSSNLLQPLGSIKELQLRIREARNDIPQGDIDHLIESTRMEPKRSSYPIPFVNLKQHV